MTETQRAADLALLDQLGRKAPDEWTDADIRAAWQAWDRALAWGIRQAGTRWLAGESPIPEPVVLFMPKPAPAR